MILIADSGSTKTDWIHIQPDRRSDVINTPGFNPFFHTSAAIAEHILCNEELNEIGEKVEQIYFFGAGVSSPERETIIRDALTQVFPKAKIVAEHDLLGAAIAVCGQEEGIACILGTGSNSCYYDGTQVSEKIPSLGYILGDEGSAGAIGKELLRSFLYQKLPPQLDDHFRKALKLNKESIFEAVYHRPGANVYLASVAGELKHFPKDPWVEELVSRHLRDFLATHVLCYDHYHLLSVGFVGSVAFHHQDLLKSEAEKLSVRVGRIVRKPILALADHYHRLHFGD